MVFPQLAANKNPLATKRKLVYKQDPDGVFRLQKIDNRPVTLRRPLDPDDDLDNELHECPYTPVAPALPPQQQPAVESPPTLPEASPTLTKKAPMMRKPYYTTKVIPVGNGYRGRPEPPVMMERAPGAPLPGGPMGHAPPPPITGDGVDSIEEQEMLEEEAYMQQQQQLQQQQDGPWWTRLGAMFRRSQSQVQDPGVPPLPDQALQMTRFNLTLFAIGFCLPSLIYVFHSPLMRSCVLILAIFIMIGLNQVLAPHRMVPYARNYWRQRRAAQGTAAPVMMDDDGPESLMEYGDDEYLVDEYGNILDGYYDEYPDPDTPSIASSVDTYGYPTRRRALHQPPMARQLPVARHHVRAELVPADMHVYPPGGRVPPKRNYPRERLNLRADGALPLPEYTTYHQREVLRQREIERDHEREREQDMRHMDMANRVIKVNLIHKKPTISKDLPMPPHHHVSEVPLMNEVRNLDRDDSDTMGLHRNNTVGSKRSILGTRANYNRFMANVDDY